MEQPATAVIAECTIWENSAGDGGGICLAGASAVIRDCIIFENSATFGGGIDLMGATDVKIAGCNVAANEAALSGGGVYVASSSYVITTCTITDNVSRGAGGGCWLFDSSGGILSTVVLRNDAYGLAGGVFVQESTLEITNGELTGNGVAIHVDGAPGQNVDARHNWWGDASGPYHPLQNPGGLGDEVSDYVDFTPWIETIGIEETTLSGTVLNSHPNPFANSTTITWRPRDPFPTGSDEPLRVRLLVYDAPGRLIATLFESGGGTGFEAITWGGRDAQGVPVASGVYLLRLEAAGMRVTERVVLIR